jgi:hypothetical protein
MVVGIYNILLLGIIRRERKRKKEGRKKMK